MADNRKSMISEVTRSAFVSNYIYFLLLLIAAICGKGKEFNNNMCVLCDFGFWKSQENNSVNCTACPGTQTTEQRGSTSVNNCTSQPSKVF